MGKKFARAAEVDVSPIKLSLESFDWAKLREHCELSARLMLLANSKMSDKLQPESTDKDMRIAVSINNHRPFSISGAPSMGTDASALADSLCRLMGAQKYLD
jgi:hypothetical protein